MLPHVWTTVDLLGDTMSAPCHKVPAGTQQRFVTLARIALCQGYEDFLPLPFTMPSAAPPTPPPPNSSEAAQPSPPRRYFNREL
ncbi:MAG TPA: hypothetical protein VMM17_10615, partial [Gemmatimonadaceae bacterium]|nr:hypothetical protein [Gemmatimonadaceae bacterium]